MRIGALKEEKEQKMKMLDDQIIKINTDLMSLLERIQTIEDEIRTQNISFLLVRPLIYTFMCVPTLELWRKMRNKPLN